MRDDDVIIFKDNIKELKYLFEVVSRKPDLNTYKNNVSVHKGDYFNVEKKSRNQTPQQDYWRNIIYTGNLIIQITVAMCNVL